MNYKNQHVFLCGFMGSGKSTLGRQLAKRMNRQFIDLDKFIENKVQKSIADLFKEQGEKTFRLLETRYLFEVIKIKQPAVVALGGGTACTALNLDIVKQNSIMVYISVSANELFERLRKSNTKRPLIKGLSPEALNLYIHRTLQEREPFYKQAHLQLNGSGLNDSQLFDAVRHYAP